MVEETAKPAAGGPRAGGAPSEPTRSEPSERSERRSARIRAALLSVAVNNEASLPPLSRLRLPGPLMPYQRALEVLGIDAALLERVIKTSSRVLSGSPPTGGTATALRQAPKVSSDTESARRLALSLILEPLLEDMAGPTARLTGAIRGLSAERIASFRVDLSGRMPPPRQGDFDIAGDMTDLISRAVVYDLPALLEPLPPKPSPTTVAAISIDQLRTEATLPNLEPSVRFRVSPFQLLPGRRGRGRGFEATATVDLDPATLVTVVNTTSTSLLDFDSIKKILDPQTWTRSEFWASSKRVIRVNNEFVDDALEPGTPWPENQRAWCFEHVRWAWNEQSLSEFQNFLNISFREIRGEDMKGGTPGAMGAELLFSLHFCQGSLLTARFSQGGVEVDNGFLRATPIQAQVNGVTRSGFRIETEKRIRFSELGDARASLQGLPGTGALISLLTPAMMKLWMLSLVQSIYLEEATKGSAP